MSRPEEEVQADIRLQAMLAEMEERGEQPSEEEMLQMRADLAISGKTQEQEDIAALAEELGTPEIAAPENPFAQYAPGGNNIDFENPFAQYAPVQDDVVPEEPPEPELSPFPEEPGTSRASIQLHELASLQAGTSMFLPETNFHIGVDQEMMDAMGGFEQMAQMSAMTGQPFMPPMKVEGLGQLAENLGMTAAMMTMTDPQEIVDTLTQRVEFENPETGEMESAPLYPGVSYQVAPDGALILVNNNRRDANGEPLRALVNRPGFSMMDALQIAGIGAAYTPAGRASAVAQAGARQAAAKAATETARRLAIRQARAQGAKSMVIGSGLTEGVLQAGHAQAGGEFNTGEVAFAAAFGVVPDYVFDPLARTATKIPSYIKGVIPEREAAELAGKVGAMDFAEETGRRLMTQDVLQERITPPMAIFAKIVERIPWVGTGRARRRMKQERIDALTELAKKYDIDVTSDYGSRVMESFVQRMTNQRFWGRQQEIMENIPHYPPHARKAALQRVDDMMERAWQKEMDELTDGALKSAIGANQIDDVVVDAVINSNKGTHLTELFERLTPEGQAAAKNRWLMQGLEEATWTPDAPGNASPAAMMSWLDKPKNRKVIEAWFDPAEQQMLKGMREYLRLSAAADKTAAGAGMVAAVGGGGSFVAGLLDAFVGLSAVTATAGHIYQSNMVRNKLLQLAHTGGDEVLTAQIMAELRPYMVAAQKQWAGDNYYFPEANISRESIKEAGADVGEYVLERGKEAIGDIGQIPQKAMEFIQGEDQ